MGKLIRLRYSGAVMTAAINFLLVAIIQAIVGGQSAGHPAFDPSDVDIAMLELDIEMPNGAELDDYHRWYWRDGDRIVGMLYRYRSGGDYPPGISKGPPDFVVYDGGCDVIGVGYDPARQVVESLHCNGVA